jgi:hypothetical protein
MAGGGDTLAAIAKYGIEKDVGYISTGGGAFLEVLEGKTLPAFEILQKRAQARTSVRRWVPGRNWVRSAQRSEDGSDPDSAAIEVNADDPSADPWDSIQCKPPSKCKKHSSSRSSDKR